MWLGSLSYEDVNVFKWTLGFWNAKNLSTPSRCTYRTEHLIFNSKEQKRDIKHKSSYSQVTYNLVQETKLKHN